MMWGKHLENGLWIASSSDWRVKFFKHDALYISAWRIRFRIMRPLSRQERGEK